MDGVWVSQENYRRIKKLISEERKRLALKLNDPKNRLKKRTRTRWKNKSRHLMTVQRVLDLGPRSRSRQVRIEFRDLEAAGVLQTFAKLLPRVGSSQFPFAGGSVPQPVLEGVREEIERFDARHPLIKLAECADDGEEVSNPEATRFLSPCQGR